ncbi:purine-nucleoside phosphorylase [Streptomyces sp. Agncl-13]|uniref:purine-nucleoside phosphorylase n=1 Tax=Streptomyces sp. Agncl-13 TaxID=3400628 RepID=UPI003A8BDD34
MSLHIDAEPGAVAPRVLLPGDPLRAQFIADRFLDRAVRFNTVRNMLGFTGYWRGERVSVQGTGMGAPSTAIYVHELMQDHGAEVLVRIGTCGALQPALEVGSIILAAGASTESGLHRRRFPGVDYAALPDFGLLFAAYTAALRKSAAVTVGGVATMDAFYRDEPDTVAALARHGVLALEMETAALYTAAAGVGRRALSILTVSDNRYSDSHATPEQRERGFEAMIELALDMIVAVDPVVSARR